MSPHPKIGENLAVTPDKNHRIKFSADKLRLNQYLAVKHDLHAREIVFKHQRALFILEADHYRRYREREQRIFNDLTRVIPHRLHFIKYARNVISFLLNFFEHVPVREVTTRTDASDPRQDVILVKVAEGYYGQAVGPRGTWIKVVSSFFQERFPVARVQVYENQNLFPRDGRLDGVQEDAGGWRGVYSQTSRLSSGSVS